jgi:molybdopterin-guanine dinucleotide biosynthesis protein A
MPPPLTLPPDILGLVLAGGASRRMGADKRTLELAGRPLLARVAARLAPQVLSLSVALDRETADRLDAGDAPDLAAAIPPGATVLRDAENTREGPLAGLLAGLRWAADQGAPRLLTVPVDTPLLPADTAARLAAAAEGDAIAVAESGGRIHHTVALVPTGLVQDLAAFLVGDDRRVRAFLARHAVRTVAFPPVRLDGWAVDPFTNLNAPGDVAAIAAALVSAGENL